MELENSGDLEIKFKLDEILKKKVKVVQRGIIQWYQKYGRDFPWRKDNVSNYEKLIAEILLQKTRAENILKVYEMFLKKYPTIYDLARANLSDVSEILKPICLFNTRAKNLVKMAQLLVDKYKGEIPSELDELLKLPGIGIYISHSYLISAYGKRFSVVDTNFKRFYARITQRLFAKAGIRNAILVFLMIYAIFIMNAKFPEFFY